MRVWRILSDFKSYPRWHPYREIEGEPVVGAKVVMVVAPKTGRGRRLKATVRAATPGVELSFTTGRPWISLATESFVLEPTARGTRLRHSADMSAFAIRLSGGDEFRTRLGLGLWRRRQGAEGPCRDAGQYPAPPRSVQRTAHMIDPFSAGDLEGEP